MDAEGLRQRPLRAAENVSHPDMAEKHVKPGLHTEVLRTMALVGYFLVTCISLHVFQFAGVPLYWNHKDLYYAWMAVSKQCFGLLIVTLTQWWSPTVVRVSGDESVRGQLRATKDGRLETRFPERMVLISNHSIYTDWLYLWWVAYTNRNHGHLYIILKESLKYIPIIGPGMMFMSFIFLSRNWASDKPRFQHRLRKLKASHKGPMSGTRGELDPMWLLIFPEGTNVSTNGRAASKRWADKKGIPDLRHALLPRHTGLHYCLEELRGTVDWVYDCTVAYEGVPRGQYGQDIYSLRGIYLQGHAPKSVNMHWRCFLVSSIPSDEEAFGEWLHQRWLEKDNLLESYMVNGRFPADEVKDGGAGHLECVVKPRHPLEFLQMFVPLAALVSIVWAVRRMWFWFMVKVALLASSA
ncbi:acyltransferase-domain-containing protein [Trichodelitschia bisporula]|uniref:Acyltransferase-domain-containing protein n=1 Tax=Trichodelitschia bisporula TaxID=703511 RepID=A0A6G1I7R8_9PEZI|nr:acyltransferase-domain-containing protein [Trichodelitschia bisporula]